MSNCREEMPQIHEQPFNMAQYEYVFDLASDIEPIPPPETYRIDFDNLDCDGGNDFDDLSQGM